MYSDSIFEHQNREMVLRIANILRPQVKRLKAQEAEFEAAKISLDVHKKHVRFSILVEQKWFETPKICIFYES